MTFAQYAAYAEGRKERMEYDHRQVAWHAANVMQPHVKRKITVDKLVGKKTKQSINPQAFGSVAELKAHLRAQKEQREKERIGGED